MSFLFESGILDDWPGTFRHAVRTFLEMASQHIHKSASASAPGWYSMPALQYPFEHLAFVAVSSLDVILTWMILARGGSEVNPVAAAVIYEWGLSGAILFKFSLTLLVVIICEVIGRKRLKSGRMLAVTAVIVSSLPVIYSTGLLSLHAVQHAQ